MEENSNQTMLATDSLATKFDDSLKINIAAIGPPKQSLMHRAQPESLTQTVKLQFNSFIAFRTTFTVMAPFMCFTDIIR